MNGSLIKDLHTITHSLYDWENHERTLDNLHCSAN